MKKTPHLLLVCLLLLPGSFAFAAKKSRCWGVGRPSIVLRASLGDIRREELSGDWYRLLRELTQNGVLKEEVELVVPEDYIGVGYHSEAAAFERAFRRVAARIPGQIFLQILMRWSYQIAESLGKPRLAAPLFVSFTNNARVFSLKSDGTEPPPHAYMLQSGIHSMPSLADLLFLEDQGASKIDERWMDQVSASLASVGYHLPGGEKRSFQLIVDRFLLPFLSGKLNLPVFDHPDETVGFVSWTRGRDKGYVVISYHEVKDSRSGIIPIASHAINFSHELKPSDWAWTVRWEHHPLGGGLKIPAELANQLAGELILLRTILRHYPSLQDGRGLRDTPPN